MVPNRYLPVPPPEKGVIIRRTGKYKHVYRVLRTFRNEKGRPDNERVLIGHLNDEGLMIPNVRYFEYYPSQTLDPNSNTAFPSSDWGVIATNKSIGASFLVNRILHDLSLDQILVDVFGPDRSQQIIAVAAYMVCRGNVLEHVQDWSQEYSDLMALSPQMASTLFASITFKEKMSFFEAWLGRAMTCGYLAYDVTSISSYSKEIHDVEWGYNRDGEKLPRINLGCYLSQDTGLPLFYVTYPGSIVDKSYMPYMMSYNNILNIKTKNIVFIMDR
jgi:hypothetical protein